MGVTSVKFVSFLEFFTNVNDISWYAVVKNFFVTRHGIEMEANQANLKNW